MEERQNLRVLRDVFILKHGWVNDEVVEIRLNE